MASVRSFSDVIVIGGGAAGLYAAIAAMDVSGIQKVTLLTLGELGSGGCSKKTHGINAALNEGDTWESHARDTYEGGGRINQYSLVKLLCEGILERIAELESWGVRFAKDGNRYQVGTYGGNSFSRSIHWLDITGLEVVQELVQRVIRKGCFVHEDRWVSELLIRDNECFGVVALNRLTNEIEEHRARAVVLATGGGTCVYPISSISSDKLATGLVLGYKTGAPMVDMEMVQFHPTGVLLPGNPGNGSLLEEEMRAQGAVLLNAARHRYMHDYDLRGELATRDVVSRSTYLEIMKGNGTANGGVIFDISKIDKGTLETRLPKTVKRLRSCGVDLLTVNEIEISPTAHFLMGGLKINDECQTEIKGLYACGEDAGGVHGANRLGGNGVAEALVFGHRCGMFAAQFALGRMDLPEVSLPPMEYYDIDDSRIRELDDELKRIMWCDVGVVRWQARLEEAWLAILEIRDRLKCEKKQLSYKCGESYSGRLWGGMILLNKIELATIITASARARKHSIGAHYLVDSKNGATPYYNVFLRAGVNQLPNTEVIYREETTLA